MDEQGVITDLRPDDVIMGRGTGPNEFGGNVRYRDLVKAVLLRHADILLDVMNGDETNATPPWSPSSQGESAARSSSLVLAHSDGRATTKNANATVLSSQDDQKYNSHRSFPKIKADLAIEIVQTIKARNGRFLQQITTTTSSKRTRRRKSGAKKKIDEDRPSHRGISASREGQRLYTEVDGFVAIDKTKQTFRHQLKVLAGLKKKPPARACRSRSAHQHKQNDGMNRRIPAYPTPRKTTFIVSQGSYSTTAKSDQDAATIAPSFSIHDGRTRPRSKTIPTGNVATARIRFDVRSPTKRQATVMGEDNNRRRDGGTGTLDHSQHVQADRASAGTRQRESSEHSHQYDARTSFALPQHSSGGPLFSHTNILGDAGTALMPRTAIPPPDALSSLRCSSAWVLHHDQQHNMVATTILHLLRKQRAREQEQHNRRQQQQQQLSMEQDILLALRRMLSSSLMGQQPQLAATTPATSHLSLQHLLLLLNDAGGRGASSSYGRNLFDTDGLLSLTRPPPALLSFITSMSQQQQPGVPQVPSPPPPLVAATLVLGAGQERRIDGDQQERQQQEQLAALLRDLRRS